MQRIGEQFVYLGLLDLHARVHHHHAVGVLGDQAHVVGDQDHCGAQLFLQLPHQVQQLRLYGHVQRGGGFVGQDDLRIAGQGHRDHHPLAHAAGHVVRIIVHAPLGLGHADQLEHLDGLVRGIPAR